MSRSFEGCWGHSLLLFLMSQDLVCLLLKRWFMLKQMLKKAYFFKIKDPFDKSWIHCLVLCLYCKIDKLPSNLTNVIPKKI